MMRKNKNVGGRVEIRKVLVEISPKVGWKYLKKVSGVIVERGDHEQYYYSSDGGSSNPRKHIILNDCFSTFAVKMDNGVVDIANNNIVVIREWDLKFLDRIEPVRKPISKEQYLRAKKIVSEYEAQINIE